jgi:hypothetical protein
LRTIATEVVCSSPHVAKQNAGAAVPDFAALPPGYKNLSRLFYASSHARPRGLRHSAILFLSFSVTWAGARVFDHRPLSPVCLLAGPLLRFFASHLPAFRLNLDLRVLLSCGIIATYTWLTGYEFWRGRSEPLVSRWPAVFLLFAPKPPDLIGRLGGEEFALVLYDIGQERAAARAELIRTAFAEAADEVDGYPLAATLSIGMAFCSSAELDLPELLTQADEALYDAKERGRNRVEVASRDLIQKRRDSLAERMAAVAAARSAA